MSISRIDTLYARIFEVKIWQNYYLQHYEYPASGAPIVETEGDAEMLAQYDVRNDLTFVPSEATATFMRNNKMLLKITSTGFFVGMQVLEDAGDYKPVRKVDPFFVLQFEIHCKNPQFFNFSALPLDGLGEEAVTTGTTTQYFRNYYYFKNRDDKFPALNWNAPLRQQAINATNDIESEQNKPIRPQAIGLIEIDAFADGGSPANIIENDVLNITNTSGVWTWPTFELTINSRNLFWYYYDNEGTFLYRTRHRNYLTKMQTNPIRVVGTNDYLEHPNPQPENIKWDATIGEYVAEVYLGYKQ